MSEIEDAEKGFRKIKDVSTIKLAFNRVLIQLKKEEEKTTQAGLIIPDFITAKDNNRGGFGKFVKMGELAFLDHGDNYPKEGDEVWLNDNVGIKFKDPDGVAYLLCEDKQVLFFESKKG